MQIPPFISLCKYGFWSHEQTHSMDKFPLFACILMRNVSLKMKDSVYNMLLNFWNFFLGKNSALYTGKYGINQSHLQANVFVAYNYKMNFTNAI